MFKYLKKEHVPDFWLLLIHQEFWNSCLRVISEDSEAQLTSFVLQRLSYNAVISKKLELHLAGLNTKNT